MATVQISFTDNSDNEEKFTIYRSVDNGTVTGVTSEVVAVVAYDTGSSSWGVTSGDVALQSPNLGDATGTTLPTGANVDPSNTGQDFVVTYTENNNGTYFYGVEAENAIGKSAIKTASSAITIAS